MFKKLLFAVISVSLIFQCGCYSSEIVSRHSYSSLDEYKGELFVMMKDGSSYKYLEKEFKITSDTLYIISHLKILSGGRIKQPEPTIKIPMEEIAHLEIKSINWGKTSMWRGGIVLGLFFMLFIALINNPHEF